MLTQLSIKNYALIQELSINLDNGLTIITGETGAGKSILLGALGLVLGNRADLSSLKNMDEKCIIEAKFDISKYQLQSFFKDQDLDFEDETIIRREILPSGKSRAFVNDTPVTLQVLNELNTYLIDVHSQHQTLQLAETEFQFYVIDALANNQLYLEDYQKALKKYKKASNELTQTLQAQKQNAQQHEYNLYVYNELKIANLQLDEQSFLETEIEKLNNVEDIKLQLSEALQIAVDEQVGLQTLLLAVQYKLSKIEKYSSNYNQLYNRLKSIKIEFDDIVTELENENESVEFNPNQLEKLNDRLQLIYQLQKKHLVSSIEELLQIQEQLAQKVDEVENADELIKQKQNEVDKAKQETLHIAKQISENRTKVIPVLNAKLEEILVQLGMENARFKIDINPTTTFLENGTDDLSFLMSSNKGSNFGELKKIASGGELSRIMLAIKRILSNYTNLPTIIFDEIDTGVSGEIANKMAEIMHQMSESMQVITITHLPQIAAKGEHHFKVFKVEEQQQITTKITELQPDDRIIEIAQMLSGKDVTASAITHAKQLLKV